MRLPGTCSRYSKKAMPQLASAARYQGRSARFFRCAYQANVMKTFEPMRSSVAEKNGFTGVIPGCARPSLAGDFERAQLGARARVVRVHDAVPAARAGGGDVVGAIIDEHRVLRCQRKALLGFRVDPRVRLHDPGEVGGQRPVPEGVQAVLAAYVGPVQVPDVGQ